MSTKNPADYVIGPDATIEDVDLDKEEIYVEGERFTEARAEQLAEETARLAREARERNLIPGRKSLSGGSKHSPLVQFRVSETTRAKLEAIAKARGISISKLSRKIIDDFVERETNAKGIP